MKPYLFLLLCCFTYYSSGQTKTETNYPPFLSIKDITFKSAGITLEGTIYKPQHPQAALVLVHGSGQETRMLRMASTLAEKGIAVLTYDKRGVGKSGGIYAGPEVGTNNIDPANLNLLALDASAASNTLLRNLPGKDLPLGLMGFSQAGWIIPLSSKINHKVNFMIVFSGPLVNTLEQLRFQFYTDGNPGFWDTHTETEAREHVRNDPDRYQFAATDPQDALNKLSIPGLWIFGGKDIQIPVGLSIEKLNLFKAQGKPYEYLLFPELTHNTASSKSPETINNATQWIQTIAESMKKE